MLTGRRSGITPFMSMPSIRIEPISIGSKPPIMRNVVVLPHPDGPSNEKNSPASIVEVDAAQHLLLAVVLLERLDLDPAPAPSGRLVGLTRHERSV